MTIKISTLESNNDKSHYLHYLHTIDIKRIRLKFLLIQSVKPVYVFMFLFLYCLPK